MKKYIALFLAVAMIAGQLGGYVPAKAAGGREVLEPSELKGNIQSASNVEETTFQGVEALKVTPDGTSNQTIQFDNWSILNEDISSNDYKYVAVDYYYQVTNPANVLKIPSNDSWPNNFQEITSSVEVGKTYVFTCDYYMTEGSTGSIRFKRDWGSLSDIEQTLQGSGTASVEYTVESGLGWIGVNMVQHPGGGTGYYWNFCLTEKGSNENLLKNTDFTSGGANWGINGGASIMPYADFEREIEELTKPANVLKVPSNNSWPNNFQEISGFKAGETYVFTCDYYVTGGSTGSIRFKRGWGGLSDVEKRIQGSGTASLEYTAEEGFDWLGVNVVQIPDGGTSYYWNFRLTKKGSNENLLKNTDFTSGGAYWGINGGASIMPYADFERETGYADEMVVRLLPVQQNSKDYRVPENEMVKNQWARLIYDVSDWATASSGANYKQMHFFPWGRAGSCKGSNAFGTMYINNISFYEEKPGAPVVTDLSFIGNKVNGVRGGSVTIPKVTVEGEHYPITDYNLQLSGHSSANTCINDGKLVIGADETANQITITAQSAIKADITDTCIVNVKDSIVRTTFDEENIITRFGVVSDVHLSGSWNQQRSVDKFAHTIEALQKTAEKDGAKLDAFLINGDLVDAVASAGNVFDRNESELNAYGSKAIQNFREVNYVAQGIWGGTSSDLADTTTGYGAGLEDGVKLFYSLGNHDEMGKGEAAFANGEYETVYSAEYFAAVICGWQFDISKDRADYTTAPTDNSYVDYINDLIDYNTNGATTVNASEFLSKYGVTLASADAKFDRYYGYDTNYSNTDGLLYGNRHMTIGEGNDAIHFVALELSLSQASLDFLEEVCVQSLKENPNKPIFVLTHYKVSEDMPGYEGVQNKVREVMAKYPQIIAWGGHSHTYLHSDAAIDSDEGFIQIDSSAIAYASQSYLTRTSQYAVNAADKENHEFGQGCYVEVDKNFNVRVNRIDIYRSFSADYAENNSVFIRDAWDITDIGLEGTHLTDYTNKRIANTQKPVLKDSAFINTKISGDAIKADLNLDATDDGLVYMYVVELWNTKTDSLVQTYYYTNKFYDYPDISKIPALETSLKFTGLENNTEYEVKVYPVDEFNVKGEAISKKITYKDIISSGDPKYMAKLIGTHIDGDGTTQQWKEVYQKVSVTPGKTYEFSFDYYAPSKKYAFEGRIVDKDWKTLVNDTSVAGEIQTMTMTYTAKDGETWVAPLISKNTEGYAYVWNLCFKEVDGNVNLLYNADFSDGEGSWIDWEIAGKKMESKKDSDKITAAYGHKVVKYDETLFKLKSTDQIPSGDPKYMAEMVGTYTDSDGKQQEYKEICQKIPVTPGKTYEFTYNYYVPGKGSLEGRLMNKSWKVIESVSSVAGEIKTVKLTYTAKEGDEWIAPLLSKDPQGTAYIWNLCFREVGEDLNLFYNADFSDGNGSWIDWEIAGKTPTDKTGSDKLVKSFGHKVVSFNKSLFKMKSADKVPSGDPKYMAKMIGTYTDSNGKEQVYKELSQNVPVSAGKTYEFTFSYYVPGKGSLEGRLMDMDWNIIESVPSVTGEVKTVKITYEAKYGDKWVTPLIAKDPQGIAYVWNMCFREVDGNVNLLYNSDFSEGDGSWISWNIGGTTPSDKAGSDNLTAAFGHEVVKFDKSLFKMNSADRVPTGDPKYMVKMVGTHTDSKGFIQIWKELSQQVLVSAGKTYEFSFNYYVPGQGTVQGRLMDKDWKIIENVVSETGEIGTMTIRYTPEKGTIWVTPLVSKDTEGYAYVWNLCFREVGGNVNLLYNSDFSEGNGSFISWNIGGITPKDRAGSDDLTKAFGHEVIKFNKKLFEKEKGNASSLNSAINPNFHFSFDDKGKYKDLDTWPRAGVVNDEGSEIENAMSEKMLAVCVGGVAVLGLAATGIIILALKKKSKKEN